MTTTRRMILHMSLSLDGFVARGDGVIDWLDGARIPDHGSQRHRVNLEMLGQTGLIAIGRGAYQDMAKGWPGSDNSMARLMNALPKVVFSQSLPTVEWSNARLSHSLVRERLVDEYRLTVHPVALGEGLSLLHGLPEPQRFELVSSTTYGDGCIAQVLRPT